MKQASISAFFKSGVKPAGPPSAEVKAKSDAPIAVADAEPEKQPDLGAFAFRASSKENLAPTREDKMPRAADVAPAEPKIKAPAPAPVPVPALLPAAAPAPSLPSPPTQLPPPVQPASALMEVEVDDDEESDDDEEEEEEEEAVSAGPIVVGGGGGGMSDYEKLRQDNIRRNEDFLRSLGLDSLKPVAPAPVRKTGGAKRPRRESAPPVAVAPSRRSARVANGPVQSVSYSEAAVDEEEEEEEEEEEQTFDDSSVLKYVMSSSSGSGSGASAGPGSVASFFSAGTGVGEAAVSRWPSQESELLESLQRLRLSVLSLGPAGGEPQPLSCSTLPAVYSMQFNPQDPTLLLAAGKGGMVALFKIASSSNSSSSSEPMLSFKAHAKWVSSAVFFDPPSSSSSSSSSSSTDNTSTKRAGSSAATTPLRVLTSSDDGLVKLWDLSRVSNKGQPALLSQTDTLHTRGIFALDACAHTGRVLTGSKDKNVALSSLRGGEGGGPLVCLSTYEWHSACVKSVAWRAFGRDFDDYGESVGESDGGSAGSGAGSSSSSSSSSSGVFASGGQDRSAYVKDVRVGGTKPELSLEGVQEGGIHTVSWASCPGTAAAAGLWQSPFRLAGTGTGAGGAGTETEAGAGAGASQLPPSTCRDYLLLTAGTDAAIHVFDIRRLARESSSSSSSSSQDSPAPLYTFRGHHFHASSGGGRTFKTILPPRFLGDSVVLSAGERSDFLSIYNAATGATISRGEMPGGAQPMAVCVGPRRGVGAAQPVAVACSGGLIYICRPVF